MSESEAKVEVSESEKLDDLEWKSLKKDFHLDMTSLGAVALAALYGFVYWMVQGHWDLVPMLLIYFFVQFVVGREIYRSHANDLEQHLRIGTYKPPSSYKLFGLAFFLGLAGGMLFDVNMGLALILAAWAVIQAIKSYRFFKSQAK